jgi:hypothetical protein
MSLAKTSPVKPSTRLMNPECTSWAKRSTTTKEVSWAIATMRSCSRLDKTRWKLMGILTKEPLSHQLKVQFKQSIRLKQLAGRLRSEGNQMRSVVSQMLRFSKWRQWKHLSKAMRVLWSPRYFLRRSNQLPRKTLSLIFNIFNSSVRPCKRAIPLEKSLWMILGSLGVVLIRWISWWVWSRALIICPVAC